VERLHVDGANTLIVAKAKTGKTTLIIGLVKSLADGVPFLGVYETAFPEGNVAILDYEMIPAQFRDWMRKAGIATQDRVVPPWHLKGEVNPLHYETELAEWFRAHNVRAAILDSAAMAYADFVDNDNSASQMTRFLDRVDRIKAHAGISDLFVIAHAGAVSYAEGNERPRGSTRLDDWPDGIWHYTSDDDGQRTFRAIGRGVDVEAQAVRLDRETHELRIVGTRRGMKDDAAALVAVDALVAVGDGVPKGELRLAICNSDFYPGINHAINRGYIDERKGKGPKGGNAQLCYITVAGQAVHDRRVKVQRDSTRDDPTTRPPIT
jgi:hypothetical protein